MVQGMKKFMDENFGKPGEAIKNMKELSDSLVSIDKEKLKELKSMMGAIGNVQMDVEQLRLIVEVVRMLCSVDIEKVKEFRQLLISLIQLVKLLPKDIKDLPIAEILQELKQK